MEVSPPSVTLTRAGATVQLSAVVKDGNGNVLSGAPVAWSSSDPDVATVDASGLVTAVAAGDATVEAASGTASGTAAVVIRLAVQPLLRLTSNQPSPPYPSDHLFLERPLLPETLTAEYTDSTGTRSLSPREVFWASTDTMIAIVRYGVVRGIRQGRTTITAAFAGSTATMPVRVIDHERVLLEQLYHATDGDNWTHNDGWLSDRPHWAPPGWYGVTAIGFRDDDQIPPARYRSQLLAEASHVFTDTLPPTAFAAADAAWATANPDSLERALVGRVTQLNLRDNNLRGQIPDHFGLFFDELLAIDLSGNELQGSLDNVFFETLNNLFVLALRGNQLSGSMPDFSRSRLFILDMSNNRLTGPVRDLSPHLFSFAIDGNELSGTMPDITRPRHDRLGVAIWYNNDGLCHPDSPQVRDAILNPGAFRVWQGPICGLALDSRWRVVVDPDRKGVPLAFDAARDSTELPFLLIDVFGQIVPGGQDSVTWTSSDSTVAKVVTHSSRAFLRSEGTGTAELSVTKPDLVEPVILFVSVDQIATSLTVPQKTVTGNAITEWTAIARDRNGVALRGLPLGAVASSSDSAVATPYRNGLLVTGTPGSVQLTVTLPNGLTSSGTIHVTGNTDLSETRIDSIRPAVLEVGKAATMYGEDLRNADVLVDGRAAVVGSAKRRRLEFTVPDDPSCLPSRGVAVAAARRDGRRGVVVRARLDGRGETVNLGVGEGVVLDVPMGDSICVQLNEGAEHLVLAQALPNAGAVIATDQLRAGFIVRASLLEDDELDQPAPDGAARVPLAGAFSDIEDDDLMNRHRRAEELLRNRERAFLAGIRGEGLAAATAQRTPAVNSATVVGDTVTLVSDLGQCDVTSENTIRGVVRAIGTYGVIVADLDNVVDYTTLQYQELSTDLERIIPVLSNYFGSFPDVNSDNRVTVVFSDKVAAEIPGLLGYVSHLNLFPKTLCAASDEMEIFFGRTPDANIPFDELDPILPALIAHELTHIIQGRRVDLTATTRDAAFASAMEHWLAEGQAQLGQEIVGYALRGGTAGSNFGSTVALGKQDGVEWYADSFSDLANYLSTTRFAGGTAPSACSWWARQPSPCVGRSLWYGVSWSFLRWINDHYGGAYSGGESGLQTAVVDGRGDAWQLLSRLTGQSFGTLLSGWGASLFLDERLSSGPYISPSWHLPDIWRELRVSLSAQPLSRFEDIDRVVLGSSKYYWFGLGNVTPPSSALTLRGFFARSPDAGLNIGLPTAPLPIGLQVFVVRVR